jgi:hypothetical protein
MMSRLVRLARQGRWVNAAVTAAFGGAIGLASAIAAHIQVASYTPIPYWDFWDELTPVERALAGSLRLRDLWVQHNEHRILLSRIQFIADYRLFGGELAFLLVMIFLSSVALAIALTLPFASVWHDRTVTLGFFAFALSVTLTPQALENLSWPFQVGFVQVYLFAITAIALAVCWLRSDRDPAGGLHVWALAVIVVLAGAATYSMGNGLVIWPTLLAVCLVRRIGTRSVAVVGIAGAAFTTSYLWGYHSVPGHTPYSKSLEHPFGMAHYVVTYLGHPGEMLGSKAVPFVGALGCLLFLAVAIASARQRALLADPAVLFGMASAAFVLVSAIQTALGRLEFGIGQALSSRYALPAGVYWASLLIAVAPFVARSVRVTLFAHTPALDVSGITFVALLTIAAIVVNLAANPSALVLDSIQTRSEAMLVANIAGVEDDQASQASYPVAGALTRRLGWLRSKRLGPWNHAIGSELETVRRTVPEPATLRPCDGSIDSGDAVRGGSRFRGWIVAPRGTDGGHAVDVVTNTGSSIGVGFVDAYRPDVRIARRSTTNFSGFVAYARSGNPAADLVLFAAGSHVPVCALRIGSG